MFTSCDSVNQLLLLQGFAFFGRQRQAIIAERFIKTNDVPMQKS
jgi:hypothetical protein